MKAIIAFKKAIATIAFKKAIADIKFGDFLIFRFFTDTFTTADVAVKAFVKSLLDTQGLTDSETIDIGKTRVDQSAASDSETVQFGKTLSDSSAISDSQNISVTKVNNDTATSSDQPTIASVKVLADNPTTADLAAKLVSKSFANQSATTDAITFVPGKGFVDSSQASDAHFFSIGFALADVPVTQDSDSKNFGKFINESTGVTDDLDGEATTNDDQEMTFVKVRSELPSLSDALVILKTKILGDSSAFGDSGSIRNQGYCAFDYFAEDYVGDSRTF